MIPQPLPRFLLNCSELLSRKITQVLLLFLCSILSGSCDRTATDPAQVSSAQSNPSLSELENFDGINLNVLTLTKPVGATIETRATEFEALTGAKITVKSALAGKIGRDETMARIAQEWNALTDRVGRDAQKASYRTSLGLDR